MNKIVEKFLKTIQDENGVSSAAGIGFAVDDPHGFVEKPKKKKREVIMDEQVDNTRHRILIDLDGVIHIYNGWNDGKLGDVIQNTKESIDDIRNTFKNVDIIIYTTRACKAENNDNTKQYIENVKKFLEKNNIYYDDITGEKLGALIYIDDNGYRFSGNWKKDLPNIKKIIDGKIKEREDK